jgi:hypothetical protein
MLEKIRATMFAAIGWGYVLLYSLCSALLWTFRSHRRERHWVFVLASSTAFTSRRQQDTKDFEKRTGTFRERRCDCIPFAFFIANAARTKDLENGAGP